MAEYPPRENERIVCAAIRSVDGKIIAGVRHFDDIMRAQIKLNGLHPNVFIDQGFLTNKRRYVTREEAWDIAQKEGQLRWGAERPAGPLFSEDLY